MVVMTGCLFLHVKVYDQVLMNGFIKPIMHIIFAGKKGRTYSLWPLFIFLVIFHLCNFFSKLSPSIKTFFSPFRGNSICSKFDMLFFFFVRPFNCVLLFCKAHRNILSIISCNDIETLPNKRLSCGYIWKRLFIFVWRRSLLDIFKLSWSRQIKSFQSHALCEKCRYSELFWSVFSRIQIEYGEILRISAYSVQMRENRDQNNSKYRHFSRSDVFKAPSRLFPNAFKTASKLLQDLSRKTALVDTFSRRLQDISLKENWSW